MIDQLASDTAALKVAEEERAEKVETTLKEVNAVVDDLKASNAKRERESKAVADQVQQLKSLIPTALEQWKANGDARLDDLSQELSGLRKLLESRVGKPTGTSIPNGRGYGVLGTSNHGTATQNNPTKQDGANSDSVAEDRSSSSASNTAHDNQEGAASKRAAFNNDRKAAIPAWQMAAANKSSNKGSPEAQSPG